MEGVFSEYSDISEIRDTVESLRRRDAPILPGEVLIVAVENAVQPEREFVAFIDFVLIEQVEEAGMLPGEIFRGTEPRVHILVAVVGHESDVLRIVFVQRHADLEIAVYGLVEDVRTPGIYLAVCQSVVLVTVVVVEMLPAFGVLEHLASETAVTQGAHSETDLHAARGVVEPAVGEVELEHARIVEEGVVVMIHRGEVA